MFIWYFGEFGWKGLKRQDLKLEKVSFGFITYRDFLKKRIGKVRYHINFMIRKGGFGKKRADWLFVLIGKKGKFCFKMFY